MQRTTENDLMSGTFKVAVEDFTKNVLCGSESGRYPQFKVMVMAKAGSENVGQLLAPGGITNELEVQRQRLNEMDIKRSAHREVARAYADKERASRAAVLSQRQVDWIVYGDFDRIFRTKELIATGLNATQWSGLDDDEIRDQENRVRELSKQRQRDNKGCGAVIEKVMQMVDEECKQAIAVIQGQNSESTVQALRSIMEWMDAKFRGHPATIRAEQEDQISRLGTATNVHEARMLIGTISTRRSRMQQSYATYGGDPVRADDTIRGWLLNKISMNAPELTQVRLIIGGMADNVPWSEGTAVMELQLSKQMTAVKQEQGHVQDKGEEKALSAAGYGGGAGGHGYSGDKHKRRDRSDSEESNKSKYVSVNKDHKICWDY